MADVALMSTIRWEATPPNSYFEGDPEIVIEVLSHSNTASEMLEREQMCLSNGGREFWFLDSDRKTVKVTSANAARAAMGSATRFR